MMKTDIILNNVLNVSDSCIAHVLWYTQELPEQHEEEAVTHIQAAPLWSPALEWQSRAINYLNLTQLIQSQN